MSTQFAFPAAAAWEYITYQTLKETFGRSPIKQATKPTWQPFKEEKNNMKKLIINFPSVESISQQLQIPVNLPGLGLWHCKVQPLAETKSYGISSGIGQLLRMI